MTNILVDEIIPQDNVELTNNEIRFRVCIRTIQYIFAFILFVIFSIMFM